MRTGVMKMFLHKKCFAQLLMGEEHVPSSDKSKVSLTDSGQGGEQLQHLCYVKETHKSQVISS